MPGARGGSRHPGNVSGWIREREDEAAYGFFYAYKNGDECEFEVEGEYISNTQEQSRDSRLARNV